MMHARFHPMFFQRSVAGEAQSFALVVQHHPGRASTQVHRMISEQELNAGFRLVDSGGRFPEIHLGSS